jgi:5-formyltetrahydrofolate cyclo-ligase
MGEEEDIINLEFLNQSKSELRQELSRKRRAISQQIWQEKSEAICQNLELFPLFIQAKTICSYFSFRNEPDLIKLTHHNVNKKWAFPRCEKKELIWHLWTPKDEQKKGSYGAKEPDFNLPTINPQEIDLILVPALACDYFGYRLGYGGGYYDRMFAQQKWQNIPAVGIIFESFHLSQLPVDSWDRKLDYICTEKEIYRVSYW